MDSLGLVVLSIKHSDLKLIWETMLALENFTITLTGVSGHISIEGNEIAEELAKKRAAIETDTSPVGVPFPLPEATSGQRSKEDTPTNPDSKEG